MRLVPIERDGSSAAPLQAAPEVVNEVIEATVALYGRQGFIPPWTGYLAVEDDKVVGTCGFASPPSSGEGPCIVFVGDSYMTVDPILAQGFTFAMESGAALRKSVERSCQSIETNVSLSSKNDSDPQLAFDPIRLRQQLKDRQVAKMNRLICLLRVTELVQALGQPNTKWTGIFNTMVLRPLMKLTPNFIKAPIFNAVLKYSLGLGLFRGGKTTW